MSRKTKFVESFLPGKSYFLTVKSPSPKHWTIGWMRSIIKKWSTRYYVIREKNKDQPGYHFHAVLQLDGPPPSRFYKKGIHMHLLRVAAPSDGKGVVNTIGMVVAAPQNFNGNELEEIRHHDPEWAQTVQHEQIMDTIYKTHDKRNRKAEHLARLYTYMHKEAADPVQFVDYLFVTNNKSHEMA